MLGLVSAVGFFETYDLYLLSLNLKQIQQELGIGEGSLGLLLSFVRSGAFFALLIVPFADRFGRRRVLIATILGYTVLTTADCACAEYRNVRRAAVPGEDVCGRRGAACDGGDRRRIRARKSRLGNRRGGCDSGVRRRICRRDVRFRRHIAVRLARLVRGRA